MYFIFEGSAKQIISRYHKIVGYPSLPPFYALGFYAGVQSVSQLNSTLTLSNSTGLPLEGFWLNHAYMDNFMDFTLDTTNFGDLNSLASLHSEYGIKTIL